MLDLEFTSYFKKFLYLHDVVGALTRSKRQDGNSCSSRGVQSGTCRHAPRSLQLKAGFQCNLFWTYGMPLKSVPSQKLTVLQGAARGLDEGLMSTTVTQVSL
jgi:hypothetical protein